ncbi:MAG: YitT family protein [Negativibacillus sp.]|nr:YitT family protein [Negativibacillus sp.]
MREFGLLNLGTFLTAIGSYFFKFPNNFSTGGVTGLSVVLTHYFPNLSNGTIVSVINVALMVVGLILLGKEFGFKTFYVTIAFSVMLKLFETVTPLTQPLTDQPFMELLFGVFLPAWGSAMLFNIGSSTGGTDIIAMVVKKYFKCHIGKALLVVDFFITVMTFVAFGPTTGLFSILGLVMRSFAVDFFLEEMNTYKSFTIITDHAEEIYQYITQVLHRGATIYHAEGVFEHSSKTIILTAQSKQQGIKLQEQIKKSDPHAFVLISNTSEIIGKGFRGGN